MSKRKITFREFTETKTGTVVELTLTATVDKDGLVGVHGKKFSKELLTYADSFHIVTKPFHVGDLVRAGSTSYGIVNEVEASGTVHIYGWDEDAQQVISRCYSDEKVQRLEAVPAEPIDDLNMDDFF